MNDGIIITKNSKVSFKTNSMIKAALLKEAKKEGLTLSSFIDRLMIEELKRRQVTLVATFITKLV